MSEKSGLERDIRFIKGIGEAKAKRLAALGIRSAKDMLEYYPRAYEDRREITPVCDLRDGMVAQFRAMVIGRVTTAALHGGRHITKTSAADETGGIRLVFFNQPYLSKSLVGGKEYLFFGKISYTNDGLCAVSPEIEPIADGKEPKGKILPVYRLTAGINRKLLMNAAKSVLDMCGEELSDPLPLNLVRKYGFSEYSKAIRNIHLPENTTELDCARRRLVFSELLALCLGLGMLRGKREAGDGKLIPRRDPDEFFGQLGFLPTGAQKRTVDAIFNDMSSGERMNRLVQGDVGSGKTAVAAAACWTVMKNGGQAALMAPTEVLASQHYENLAPLMARFGIKTALLTGKTKVGERRKILAGLSSGEIGFAVGTHALFSEDVAYFDLDLVVCDEQQRFGVDQRAALASKGGEPHVLVMSATPIPRTLSLVLYGDLDVSIIDELPPGRKPVATYVVGESMRQRIEAFVRKQTEQGHQVYIVCPAIDEDDTEELKSVSEYAGSLASKVYGDLRVGILHGRMKPAEKEKAMELFRKGETDILVSTTVIEVGVDNPNATLMVIENAERFGLSQLHQLRGRVGRGSAESFCVLMTDKTGSERLKALAETNDGFKIAEKDLEIRGPGEFFGSRQSGVPGLRLASLTGDMSVLKSAQDEAREILAKDPLLEHAENKKLTELVDRAFSLGAGNRFN
ncbi:MAG: ATP-dependent DNA helicase RecG [Oscillospiraceae bacterium]|nr:ATP-dependent DNA helicase RecG [Oscillospiraceae bacterium]